MKHTILAAVSAVLTKPTVAAVGWDGVRRRLNWVVRGSWLLRHPRVALEIAKLIRSPHMRPILRTEPRLMFKYLFGYLATDLSREERASMLLHHYALLQERVDERFFEWIVERRLDVWETKVGESEYRIGLSFPHNTDSEGDLALFFRADSVDIYTLSFTIGPGSIAGVPAADAMYIARVQGKGHGLERIRKATKDCHDVSPATLLLAAAEGVAQALDIDSMIGIGAAAQISTSSAMKAEDLVKAYDEFWTSAGGLRLVRNMYQLAVPGRSKSILEVKRDHRSRTHRKRRFRKAVKEQACAAFRAVALRPSPSAPALAEGASSANASS